MKSRIFAVLLAGLLLFCLFPFAAAAQGSVSAILLSPDAGEPEHHAAGVLRDYLEEITGARPEIVSSGPQDETIELRLTQDAGAPKGSYTLRSGEDGASFYIEASEPRGLWNGVYGFLRRLCGVEVYSPFVVKVPKNEAFSLPESYEYRYEPLLEYADTDWASGRDPMFAVANGLNGSRSGIGETYGKPVNYLWFCHTLGSGILPYWELFDAHPEYYALTERSGRREPTQLCLSNPDVLRLTIDAVRQKLDAEFDPDAALNIVSVSQLDNFDYCVCENCAALAREYGGPSGTLIWFVNQVAEAIEPAYPDAVIDTFAYEYTRHAPTGLKVRDNVCVRLCSIECCFAHALDDPACEVNASFYKDLKDWSAICDRLYVWDYTTDFNQSLGVYPNFGVLRDNLRIFRENHVVGVFEQGVGSGFDCDTEFGDLRAWLLACNMREDLTEEENDELRRGFLEAYYGEGADEMETYLGFLTEHAGDRDGHIYCRSSMLKALHGVTGKDVRTVDALWETAAAKCEAAGNTAAAARVRKAQLSWRYYKACTGRGEFRHGLLLSRWTKANGDLLEDLRAFGTYYDESKLLPETVSPLLYPSAWVETERDVLTIDFYLIPVLAALALLLTVAALLRKKYFLLLALIPALCGIFCTTWLVDLSQFRLALTASLLFALIILPVVSLAIIGYSGKRGNLVKKAVPGAVIVCALAGAFAAVLAALDKNMLNGLDSHLAYFTVCLVLEGLALLGLPVLLPCAFLKKKNEHAEEE